MAIRTQCAIDALHDVCSWLENGGEVAVSYITLNIVTILMIVDGVWVRNQIY
jgi:hypothetical protein